MNAFRLEPSNPIVHCENFVRLWGLLAGLRSANGGGSSLRLSRETTGKSLQRNLLSRPFGEPRAYSLCFAWMFFLNGSADMSDVHDVKMKDGPIDVAKSKDLRISVLNLEKELNEYRLVIEYARVGTLQQCRSNVARKR